MLTPYLLQATVLGGAIALVWPAAGTVGLAAGAGAPDGPSPIHVPARFLRELGIVAPWVFAFPSIAFVVLPAQVRAHLGGFAILYAGLVAAVSLAAGILIEPLARPRPARRVATSLGSPLAVMAAGLMLGVGYGACLIAGLRWIEATTPPEFRGRVTGIFYLLTYLGFWPPTLLAALARRAGEGMTLCG